MKFNDAFSYMLYARMEEPDFYLPLDNNEVYQSAHEAFQIARKQFGDDEQVQQLINALYRVTDLQAQYIYRMGIQDGMEMTKAEFVTKGIA